LPAIDLSAPRDPIVRDGAGKIVAFRLYDDDGRPYSLSDAAQANPGEFAAFAAAFEEEE